MLWLLSLKELPCLGLEFPPLALVFLLVVFTLPATAGQITRSRASRSASFGACMCPGLPAPGQRWEGWSVPEGKRSSPDLAVVHRQIEVSGFGEYYGLIVGSHKAVEAGFEELRSSLGKG